LVKHHSFGYLALSLDVYNSYEFFKLKKLNAAILVLEGINENDERINMFLYSSDNNIFKLNKKIFVLDYDKKQSALETFLYNNINPFIRKLSTINKERETFMHFNSSSIISKEFQTIFHLDSIKDKGWNHNQTAKLFNNKKFIDEFNKSTKEVFYEIIQANLKNKNETPKHNHRHDTLKPDEAKKFLGLEGGNIKSEEKNIRKPKYSHTFKVFHHKFDLGEINFHENENLLNLERKKLIYISEIFTAIVDIEKEMNRVDKKRNVLLNKNINLDDDKIYFSYECFLISDPQSLAIILDIIILFILGVLHKEISRLLLTNVLEKIFKHNNLIISFNLKKFFNSESSYLLGIYFKLTDHLFYLLHSEGLEQSSNPENISQIEYKMNNLIPHLDYLGDIREKSYEVYAKNRSSIYDLRKLEINNTLVKFYENSKIFESVVKITQHLNDYIIFNRFEKDVILKCFNQYKIFLEMRNIFFSYLNKKSETNSIFETLSDRIHNQYKSEALTNLVFFKHKDAMKENFHDSNSVKKFKVVKTTEINKNLNSFEQKKEENNIFISQAYCNTDTNISSNDKTSKKGVTGNNNTINSTSHTLPEIRTSKFKTSTKLITNNNNLKDLNKVQTITEFNENLVSPKSKTTKSSANKEFKKLIGNYETNRKEKKFLSDLITDKEKLHYFETSHVTKQTSTIDNLMNNSRRKMFFIKCDMDRYPSEQTKDFIKRDSPKCQLFKQFHQKKQKKSIKKEENKVNIFMLKL